MNIGLDLRCLPQDGSPGAGVAHAARDLASALVALEAPGVEWIAYLPNGARWDVQQEGRLLRVCQLPNVSGGSLRSALRQEPCDVVLILSGAVPPWVSVPAIPWVHDLAIYRHPEWFPQSRFKRMVTTWLFRSGIKRAPRVLAVSQDTKNELVQLFHLDPATVEVTQAGGDGELSLLQDEVLERAKHAAAEKVLSHGIINPYILALGTIEPRKNFAQLITTWKKVVQTLNHPVDLVIAGRDGWKFQDVSFLVKEQAATVGGKSHLHRIPVLSDEEKRELLLAADIVVAPSLHEGFGLVPLEAMQAGTAVVASDAGALPEVIQGAGSLVLPHEHEAWVIALHRLLSNPEERKRMAQAGKAQSNTMTWQKTAQIVLQSLTKTVR